jgi:hypothetical protein
MNVDFRISVSKPKFAPTVARIFKLGTEVYSGDFNICDSTRVHKIGDVADELCARELMQNLEPIIWIDNVSFLDGSRIMISTSTEWSNSKIKYCTEIIASTLTSHQNHLLSRNN